MGEGGGENSYSGTLDFPEWGGGETARLRRVGKRRPSRSQETLSAGTPYEVTRIRKLRRTFLSTCEKNVNGRKYNEISSTR